MYKIGTLVLYDKRGVYKIESIGPSLVRGTSGDYYKLRAIFSTGNEIIYTPVDMVASMRPLISNSEATNYLELFVRLEPHAFHCDGEDHSGGRVAQIAHAVAYEDLIHDVVKTGNDEGENTWNRKFQQQLPRIFCAQIG